MCATQSIIHTVVIILHRPQQEWLNMGLFRDPRKRLVSGWNHDKHANGYDAKKRSVRTAVEYCPWN